MSVRHVQAAHASVQTFAADAYELTTGRLVGTTAALVALAGVIAGTIALRRARRGADGRRGALAALVAGPAGVVVGVLNLAVADGGPGTGNGVIGGGMALLLGLAATLLGGSTLARSRRPAPPRTSA
ncbi:DUF6223 family protein [Streptomyces filamentosus]|uniref:DUF6223 family protein n=1 Tax=Streptomyces filamentosus TaxID=67294 RepID=UPI0036EAF9FE